VVSGHAFIWTPIYYIGWGHQQIYLYHQGFVVTGVTYYLQAWCVVIKGPVFFAVWTPLCFVLTIFCSSFFLGEIVRLGRYVINWSKLYKLIKIEFVYGWIHIWEQLIS
jgi:hypothetical protein